jgi:[NiFe] hydrogenase diaphorase moiety large subunit
MPIQNKSMIFDRETLDKENSSEFLIKALAKTPSDLLMEVRESGLKGRGGAGFPTGTKWMLASAARAEKKFVVCNADEGEPGTFKDRILLDEFADLVFDGMVICAYAIGATKGSIYLRGEYRYLLNKLNRELEEYRNKNRLGKNLLNKNFEFDIEIRLGSGAYVCGEESALIESLEGHRGEARNRPPFPVNTGYMGFPTVVNNVETLATVPIIIGRGFDWFNSFGTMQSKGTKLISVSGDCDKPGVYEVPFGITLNSLLEMVSAKNTKAVQVGGASGHCVPKSQFDRAISFEDLSTGGSIMVFNESRDMIHILKNFMEFFVEESCGQCTPCRIGNVKLLEGVEKLQAGDCSLSYLKDLIELGKSMQLASKCGLGQSSPNPFISIMTNFENEIFSQR